MGGMLFLKKLFERRRPEAPESAAISPSIADAIAILKANGEESVRLVPGGSERSRLGGVPDMAGEWPRFKGQPLCFVAQIDLAEMQAAAPLGWLPDNGRLLFFYDLDHGSWGSSRDDIGSWRAIYEPNAAPPALEPADLSEYARFPAWPVTFAKDVSYAGIERTGLNPSLLNDASFDALEMALKELEPARPTHRIGGYPDVLQSDTMEIECAMVAGGSASDWRLLLQVDTDHDFGMMWGDVGTLYFWIRDQDVRARDFSNVWMILQSH